MEKASAVVIAVLVGCTGLRPAHVHLDRAERLLKQGELDEASSAFRDAERRASETDRAWVTAEANRGRARVELAKLRKSTDGLLQQTYLEDLKAIRAAHEAHIKVRKNGGDDDLERQLVSIIQQRAERIVTAAAANPAPHWHTFAELLRYQIGDAIASRIARFLETFQATHQRRAEAAGAGRPLLQRAHQGLVNLHGGPAPPAAPDLSSFERHVDVRVQGVPCPQLASTFKWFGRGSRGRRVELVIDVERCELHDRSSESVKTIDWVEDVIVGYKTEIVNEKQCGDRQVTVASLGYDCTTNAANNTTCTNATQQVTAYVCTNVKVEKQVPITKSEPRTSTFTEKQHDVEAGVSLRFTATRDGRPFNMAVNEKRASKGVVAPAAGTAKVTQQGAGLRPLSELQAEIEEVARGRGDVVLSQAFAVDVERAREQAATAARAGLVDEEEEAWLRAVLVGGDDAGVWNDRYGANARLLRDVLKRSSIKPHVDVKPLPASTLFAVVARPGDKPTLLEGDRKTLLRGLPTSLAGRTTNLELDGRWLQMPAVETPTGTLGGEAGALIGVRFANNVLSRGSPWGLRFVDELELAGGVGARVDGADSGIFALRGRATYSAGFGYRQIGRFGVAGGLRPGASALKVGGSTATYLDVPAFVRLELPMPFGTIALEGTGFSVYGATQWGGALYFGGRPRATNASKHFMLRVERATTDVSVEVPGTTMSVAAADVLSISVMFGIGVRRR